MTAQCDQLVAPPLPASTVPESKLLLFVLGLEVVVACFPDQRHVFDDADFFLVFPTDSRSPLASGPWC